MFPKNIKVLGRNTRKPQVFNIKLTRKVLTVMS